jgi:hypothetical protein
MFIAEDIFFLREMGIVSGCSDFQGCYYQKIQRSVFIQVFFYITREFKQHKKTVVAIREVFFFFLKVV